MKTPSRPSETRPAPARETAAEPAGGAPEESAAQAPPPGAGLRGPTAGPVVGVGTSAGGLEAVSALFAAMPDHSGIAFLVVPHLDPDHHSQFAELIAQKTAMPVAEATDGERLRPDRVYVIPPNRTLTLSGDRLRVVEPAEPRGHRHAVDALFRSLAAEHGQRAVGIVLSGTGSDGTGGLREIQGRGGLAIAQTPATARFDGMPRSAIDAGVVDHVLAPDEIPACLLSYARHPYLGHDDGLPPPAELASEEAVLETVVTLLRKRTRHDLGGYRRPTLLRRLHRRMGLARVERLGDYLELLRESPDELEALAQDFLIHVTGFFRDPEAWQALDHEVIAPLVAAHRGGAPIRIWVPGCATGEEAYTLAILFRERLADCADPAELRLFATDVSESVLARAREGLYAETLLYGLTPERRQRFFTAEDRGWRVQKTLREAVIFALHDLIGDPPFSRLDLISCRNVLIYLDPAVQQRLLAILHLALGPGGHLFLGHAESAGTREELFEPVSKKHRIFRRVGPTRQDLVSFSGIRRRGRETTAAPAAPQQPRWARIAGKALMARYAPASVLVDRRHHVLYFHGETDRYLAQPAGEPTRDLVALARRGLAAPLRRALAQASAEGEATVTRVRRWGRQGAEPVTITVAAVESPEDTPELWLVSFEERAAANAGAAAGEAEPDDDQGSGRQLEDEFAALREALSRTVEDAEAGHEELQAANEEMTSMNEELQSTNEELEASKEELQSLNEELRTVNSQLERKVNELEELTGDLKNLLVSTDQATLFLDRDLRIRRFTSATTLLLEVLDSDVGRPLGQLATTAATEGMTEDARAVLATLVPREREIEAGDRWYRRRTLPYRGRDDRVEGVVATFVEITSSKRAEQEATAARAYAEAIVATVRHPVVVLSPAFEVRSANAAFYRTFGLEPSTSEGRSVFALGGGRWDLPQLRELLAEVLPRQRSIEDFEFEAVDGDSGRRALLLNAHRLDSHELVLLALEDVTAQRRQEGALREARDQAREAIQVRDRFMAVLSHELRTPLTPALAIVSRLREAAATDEVVRRDLARVQRNLEYEARLIDDLLDLSRIESGRFDLQPREIDLREVAAEAAEVLTAERLEAAGLTLALELPRRSAPAWGDPVRLVQVLHNLLVNAAKFTPAGGTITMRLRAEDDSQVIEVEDTGVGIAAEELPGIFDRFGAPLEVSKRAASGLGLGLSISRAIVERHGGELTAASPGVGRGSTVSVRLPPMTISRRQLPAAARAEREAKAAQRPLPAHGPLHIVLVEDDPDSREALAELLEVDGHEVARTGSRAEALAVVEQRAGADGSGTDLVICDVGLPDGSGVELMRELIARHGLSGIALTGYGMGSDVRASLEAGFLAHFTKPVDIRALREAIQSLRAER